MSNVREEMKKWNEMYGIAANEILRILEGLPLVVADAALDAAKSSIRSDSIVGKSTIDFTDLPRFGL